MRLVYDTPVYKLKRIRRPGPSCVVSILGFDNHSLAMHYAIYMQDGVFKSGALFYRQGEDTQGVRAS